MLVFISVLFNLKKKKNEGNWIIQGMFVTQILTDQASICPTEPCSNHTEQATGESGDAAQTFLNI